MTLFGGVRVWGALLALAGPAAAQEVAVQLLYGVGGSLAADEVQSQGGDADLPEQELAAEVGIELRIDTEISPDLWVGVRGAWLGAEAGEGSVDAFDGGMTARLLFPQPSLDLYALVGIGLTKLILDEALERSETFEGVGWHLLVGAGLQVRLGERLRFVGGLAWHRQAADLEDEDDTDLEMPGAVVNRLLLSAGVSF